ncbi:aliphatic sulfonate ABC transporter substrate-binding protein [Streptomyces triticirhizae]|uniref:Aliphatic sulfonate ABC transporter substrate-binding protein n=1 Tax=Streptomyces triticirhizae TaxID=2483353 RepID=A0A3M2LCY9_9ACTN|nr:aliphatic sulfonate ABC transporter substrate-binding protein [Streptomyces triticirhizae]RMI34610.1 aliphatic sulfonate ABC transporter substrate-binding protein [Streptomyces triticirhizae]
MRAPRRVTVAVTTLLLLAATATACGGEDESGGGSNSADRIRFGYISDYNGASPLAVADEQDLWEKYELAPETTVFTNGPIQIQALGSGDLDFGYIGPGAMWLPASDRAEVIAINTLAYADRVIAQPGIGSVADLAGRKVGVPEGTSGEMVLGLALREAGMTTDDIEVVPMDPATVVSAFASGQIDAAGIWYPLIDTIKEQVPELVEVASTRDFPDDSFPTAFVAGNDVDEDVTTRVVRLLQEANDWRAAHPDETVELTAELLEISPEAVAADAANIELLTTDELLAATEDGTAGQWLDGLAEFFVETGKLESVPAWDGYYNAERYVEAAR